MSKIQSRVAEVQSHIYDSNDNPLFTPDMIKKYIEENKKLIKRWSWVIHDKDVYTLEDEVKANKRDLEQKKIIAGKLKPKHIHLALEFFNPMRYSTISRSFDLPQEYIVKPRVKYNQFQALSTYQSHKADEQQALGKHLYLDEEIYCNFNYTVMTEEYLKARNASAAKRMKKSEVDDLINRVAAGEILIREIKDNYGVAFYLDYEKKLEKARIEYIKTLYVPGARYNFYIDSWGMKDGGGVGKTSAARLLARALFPMLEDYECYHEVSKPKVAFDKYEEQPVIVWNEARAGGLVKEFGNSFFDILEPHPGKASVDVKYDDKILVHTVNIINGIQPYEEFLNGLAGEYTDRQGVFHKSEKDQKNQVYRRFPFIIRITPESFDFFINQGFFKGTNEYMDYVIANKVTGSIKKLMQTYDQKALKTVGSEMFEPVVNKFSEARELTENNKISDPDTLTTEDLQFDTKIFSIDSVDSLVLSDKYPQGWYPKAGIVPPPFEQFNRILSLDECRIFEIFKEEIKNQKNEFEELKKEDEHWMKEEALDSIIIEGKHKGKTIRETIELERRNAEEEAYKEQFIDLVSIAKDCVISLRKEEIESNLIPLSFKDRLLGYYLRDWIQTNDDYSYSRKVFFMEKIKIEDYGEAMSKALKEIYFDKDLINS